ncbi:uncharacterized protein LOC142345345 isoform X2 [Convolutriloba macropyga]
MSSKGEKEYVDNYMNRALGRAGEPMGERKIGDHHHIRDCTVSDIAAVAAKSTVRFEITEVRTPTTTKIEANFEESLTEVFGKMKVSKK